jgi:rhodanese-related sulfurtransferase
MKNDTLKTKVLAALLLVVGLLGLAACGNEPAANVPAAQPTNTTAPVVKEEPTAVVPQVVDVEKTVADFFANTPDNFYAVGKIDAVKEMMNSGALVVDLRQPEDYAKGHIPGAVNIPMRDLAKNLDKIPYDKPVLMTCASGYRAAMGLASLQILGYDNVRSFPGSYKAWTEAKETVSTEATTAAVVGDTKADKVLVDKVDAFASSLPEDWAGIFDVKGLADVMANTDATLIDLRPADEYSEGHIPDAVNIPFNELGESLDKVPTDKPVILSCASGHRAGMALAALRTLGYDNARAFPPSYNGWKAAQEAAAPALDMQKVVDDYLTNMPDGYYNIGKVDALKEMMASGNAMLVDVRQPEDYAKGHIPGAVNIPIRELAKNLDKLPTDKPVVLSCASGLRCTIGTTSLQILGYDNVRTFFPSYKGWTEANGEVSTDVVEAKVIGAPKVDPALLAKVDAFLSGLPDNYYSIGKVDALKELMATGNYMLVDVREAADYAEGHIPTAVNIPIRELAKNLDKLPKDKPLVLSCASGLRCTLAMPALQLLGYDNARTFTPSFNGWKSANQEIEK